MTVWVSINAPKVRKVASLIFMTNKEIAKEIGLKRRTIDKYVECLLDHFKVHTRTAIAHCLVTYGWFIDWVRFETYIQEEWFWKGGY